MTAIIEGQPRTKRSKGFTIDSIIGSDSDRHTDEHTPVCERVAAKSPDSATRHSDITGRLSGDRGSDRGSDSDHTPHRRDSAHGAHRRDSDHAAHRLESDQTLHHRDNEHISHRRDSEHSSYETNTHYEHERLRRKDSIPHSAIENGTIQRTVSSLHRDAVRDLNFTTSRDGPSSETLKHFHETLMQNATQANSAINLAGMGMPFGHFDAQRHCRHPLAGLNIPGYPSPIPAHPQLHPGVLLNGATRDIRQMYPYIADRYPGYFHPRFGLGGMPGLFFQPYRKPKRIRTAFSPSQLLQLEKSFEKSHYVVGQERKDLANELQLSETQVKVWFQNRRTKYKRTKAEQDGGPGDRGDPHSPCHEDESDISDIDDIDDVGNEYTNPHAYPAPIQTC